MDAQTDLSDLDVLDSSVPNGPFEWFVNRFGKSVVSRIKWPKKKGGRKHKCQCRVTIDGHTFTGSGISKKAARYEMALEAMKVFEPDAQTHPVDASQYAGGDGQLPAQNAMATERKEPDLRKTTLVTILDRFVKARDSMEECSFRFDEIPITRAPGSNRMDDSYVPKHQCTLLVRGQRFVAVAGATNSAKMKAAKLALEGLFQYDTSSFVKAYVEQSRSRDVYVVLGELLNKTGYHMKNETDVLDGNMSQVTYIIDGERISGEPCDDKREARVSVAEAVFRRIYNINWEDVAGPNSSLAAGKGKKHNRPTKAEVRTKKGGMRRKMPNGYLNELCARRLPRDATSKPKFEILSNDQGGATGLVTMKLMIRDKVFECSSTGIKQAKRQCAIEALKALFNLDVPKEGIWVPRDEKRQSVRAEYEKSERSSVHRPIECENKGFKMLRRMGWQDGACLGKHADGITVPVVAHVFFGKGGVGSKHLIKKSLDYGSTSLLSGRKPKRAMDLPEAVAEAEESANDGPSGVESVAVEQGGLDEAEIEECLAIQAELDDMGSLIGLPGSGEEDESGDDGASEDEEEASEEGAPPLENQGQFSSIKGTDQRAGPESYGDTFSSMQGADRCRQVEASEQYGASTSFARSQQHMWQEPSQGPSLRRPRPQQSKASSFSSSESRSSFWTEHHSTTPSNSGHQAIPSQNIGQDSSAGWSHSMGQQSSARQYRPGGQPGMDSSHGVSSVASNVRQERSCSSGNAGVAQPQGWVSYGAGNQDRSGQHHSQGGTVSSQWGGHSNFGGGPGSYTAAPDTGQGRSYSSDPVAAAQAQAQGWISYGAESGGSSWAPRNPAPVVPGHQRGGPAAPWGGPAGPRGPARTWDQSTNSNYSYNNRPDFGYSGPRYQ